MKLVSKISNNTKLNYDITSKTVNTSGNKIKSIVSNATVNGYDSNTPEIVNVSNINLPNNNGIFDPSNDYYTEFGGNQGELITNIENYIEDPKIREIITKYYPEADLSADNLELLFYRMNSVGCGYIAAINTILRAYETSGHDEKDFYKRFGFPPYDLRSNQVRVHQMDKDYNYEYLFLDFFLYYAKNNGFNTLEKVIGNTEEQMVFRNNQSEDLSLSAKDFKLEGMDGALISNVAMTMYNYLIEKGINLRIESIGICYGFPVMPDDEEYEELEAKFPNKTKTENAIIRPLVSDDFEKYINEDKQVIITDENFTLYYPKDVDGNGKYDDVYRSNIGSHAMSVVGVADDNKLIVSSWGKEYLFDFKEDTVSDYIIYDYGDFEPVEKDIKR